MEKNSAYLFGDNIPVILRLRVWFVEAIHKIFIYCQYRWYMETCTPHFRMKQNRKIGNVVLIKPTPKKKKECMRFQPIASQKVTQTHQISSTVVERIWYTDTPIKHYQFTRFMHDIFINVKCSTTYTANCLIKSNRHLADERCRVRIETHYAYERPQKWSIRNRDCSMQLKKKISDTLASLVIPKSTISNPEHSTVVPRVPSAEIEETVTPARNDRNLSLQSYNFMSSVCSTSEMTRNSFVKSVSASHNKQGCVGLCSSYSITPLRGYFKSMKYVLSVVLD